MWSMCRDRALGLNQQQSVLRMILEASNRKGPTTGPGMVIKFRELT